MTGFNIQDALLRKSAALPNGAAATTTASIDLGITSRADFVEPAEFVIESPALGATPLPNAKTMIYTIEHSDDNSAFVALSTAGTQTGASGVGAGKAEYRYRAKTNIKRYVRAKATGSTTGDASGSTFVLSLRT